ncbi:peptidase associated/transthyretin-like domain-containing protein [Galbibacter mesophilus]|uniref:hypothetical protein n=1 Tax=Galbibacter mesophilus TaxID=379069 RepID=UPI00191D339C|nr:hypothetical protein [Galbibacter mesophilus]MCM5662255.1 carboxypeptidase-like regulatory domain-containing protein [Galbibacter mesophilus]
MRFTLLLLFISLSVTAQNQLGGVILDSASKRPLEFVDVYNRYDYTITNADGSFLFLSEGDSVILKKLGYKELRTTFEKLQNKKHIFLSEASIALDEVVVTNESSIFDKINKAIPSNYPFRPFEERFMLRAVLKKNDSILKIEDLSGKVKRQQLLATKEFPFPKKNFEIELLNMRKAGLEEEDVEFKLNDFNEIFRWFNMLFVSRKYVDTNIKAINENTVKIDFATKDSVFKADGDRIEGYWMINTTNHAILEGMISSNRTRIEYNKSGPYRYWTPFFAVNTIFSQHENGRYFIKNSRVDFKTEVVNSKTEKKDFYTCSYILTSQDNFNYLNTNSNVSEKRDIFKLKYPYNPDFWEKQNQLLFTEEMLEFLATVKDENNEYRAVSNLN